MNSLFSKLHRITLAFVLAVSVASGSLAATPISAAHAASTPLYYSLPPTIYLDPNTNTVTGRDFRPYDIVTVSEFNSATGQMISTAWAYVQSDGTLNVRLHDSVCFAGLLPVGVTARGWGYQTPAGTTGSIVGGC